MKNSKWTQKQWPSYKTNRMACKKHTNKIITVTNQKALLHLFSITTTIPWIQTSTTGKHIIQWHNLDIRHRILTSHCQSTWIFQYRFLLLIRIIWSNNTRMASKCKGESSKKAQNLEVGHEKRKMWCIKTSSTSSWSKWDWRILQMPASTLVKRAISKRDEMRRNTFWPSSNKLIKTPPWRLLVTTGWSRFQSLPIWRPTITKRRQRWSQITSPAILDQVLRLSKMKYELSGRPRILARHS